MEDFLFTISKAFKWAIKKMLCFIISLKKNKFSMSSIIVIVTFIFN